MNQFIFFQQKNDAMSSDSLRVEGMYSTQRHTILFNGSVKN